MCELVQQYFWNRTVRTVSGYFKFRLLNMYMYLSIGKQIVQTLMLFILMGQQCLLLSHLWDASLTLVSPFSDPLNHRYQLEQSISVFMSVKWYFFSFFFFFFFFFASNFTGNITFLKQTEETLIRRRIVRCLIRVTTVCLCPIKKDAMLKLVKRNEN